MSSKNRLTVNLSGNEYQRFQTLSKELDVSMAWVGRQATIQLLERNESLSDQHGLFDIKIKREAK